MDILNEYVKNEFYLKHELTEKPIDGDFPLHIHDTCELYLFLGGNTEYLVEGNVYTLSPGNIVILSPHETHKTKILSSEPYERYVVNFPCSMFDSIDPQRRLLRVFLSRKNGHDNLFKKEELGEFNIRELFDGACYCNEDDYGKELKIKSLVLKTLEVLNSVYQKRESASDSQSREVEIVAYVNERLFEEINVPLLAKRFFLSTSQFNRIFKNATGVAPWRYIAVKRLSIARERLKLGDSVKNAFETSGFKDYSSFYRAYVKYFGKSPVEDTFK